MNISLLVIIFYTFIYFMLNLLAGLSFLKLFFKKWKSYAPVAILSSALMLGVGILAAFWLFLSLLGQLKTELILGFSALLFILSIPVWKDTYILVKEFIAMAKTAYGQLSFFWKVAVFILFWVIVSFGFGSLLLPPMGDAEAYYMTLPKMVSGTGRILPLPNYFEFSKLGFIGEAHYAVLMSLVNFHAAKFFVWFVMWGAIGFMFSIANLLGAKAKGQIIALVMLMSTTTFTNYIFDGKIDVFSAAFGLAAFYWAVQTKKQEILPLVLTGLFLGFSVVTKLSNLFAIFPGIFLLVIWDSIILAREEKRFWLTFTKKSIKFSIIVFFFFLLAISPHLVKNKIIFQDPLAISNKYQNFHWTNPLWARGSATTPVFTSTLSPVLTPSTFLPINQESDLIGHSNKLNNFQTNTVQFFNEFFKIFLRAWSYPLAFFFGERAGQGGNLSVLILLFLPFLFFGRLNTLQKQILLTFSLSLGLWILIRAAAITPRYILPALLIFIPLIAVKTENILEIKKFIFVKIAVFLSLIFVLAILLFGSFYFAQRFNWVLF